MAAVTGPISSLCLSVPTPSDFRGIAVLQTAAGLDERGWMESEEDMQKNHYQTYQRYQRDCPVKLQHCRIIKCPNDGKHILAACQLQLRRSLPRSDYSKTGTVALNQSSASNHGDVFIEWIACHPDYMNKGIGSMLLKWASDFAKQKLEADRLTLCVIKANKGAVRLYKRRGFVVQEKGRLKETLWQTTINNFSGWLGSAVGCDNFTVLTMEKLLL